MGQKSAQSKSSTLRPEALMRERACISPGKCEQEKMGVAEMRRRAPIEQTVGVGPGRASLGGRFFTFSYKYRCI